MISIGAFSFKVVDVFDNVIMEEFESIREEVEAHEDAIQGFFEYVDRTWIGRRIGLTRKRPLFPVPSWNHHATLLTGELSAF
jgi:hypothetical protein